MCTRRCAAVVAFTCTTVLNTDCSIINLYPAGQGKISRFGSSRKTSLTTRTYFHIPIGTELQSFFLLQKRRGDDRRLQVLGPIFVPHQHCGHQSAASPHVQSIMSRVSHSVLFHHKHRKLYIFGGQRGKHYLTDFLIYDVDGAELTSQTDSKNVPQSGFTQRAAIDCDKDEIYVLASLSKEKERRNLNINSFWLFPLAKREWCCVYKSDPRSDNCYLMNQNACPEPCPRYAHQNVYDAAKQAHFLFGGNPGMNSHFRLDDFWMLLLETPTRDNILRYCKYLLRKKEYEEVAQTDPLAAIRFLLLYDISDPAQLKEFNILASLLFKSNASAADGESVPTSLLTCSLSGGGGQKHPNEHDPDGDNEK